MRLIHFFVDRPIFASVVSLVLVIFGVVSYAALPVSQYPEIVPPTVVVRASYPGADAATVAATVASPIEQEVNGVDDMLYMSSLSTNDGSMQLTITFKLGTNLDAATVLVQNRVAVAEPRLPADVRSLGIVVKKSSPDLMVVIQLMSPDETYDEVYMANYIHLHLRDKLARLPGVGDTMLYGGSEYGMRIWIDPDRLAGYGITANEVVEALRKQNIQIASGSLGAPPSPSTAAKQIVVKAGDRFRSASEFEAVILKSHDGRLVRLGDVAQAEFGQKEYLNRAFLNGKPSVGIGLFQRPGTNAIETGLAARRLMDDLKKKFPSGLEYGVPYDTTEFVSQSVHEVYRTLLEAAILVIVVILVFLKSWRTAIVPILAIPVSLLGTVSVMAAFGFSINNLTMFGLVLAIGIVVDDAIVVVENVERLIAEGLSPGDAAHRTMDEVGGAVVAIALVLSAVFIPSAFIPGISGQFYKQFALTIAASTIISAINSLTLSPALCKLLLKPAAENAKSRVPGAGAVRCLGRLFDRTFDALTRGYSRVVRLLVSGTMRLASIMAAYVAIVACAILLAWTTPTGFIPVQDQGYLLVVAQLPAGSSLDRTTSVMNDLSERLLKIGGTLDAVVISGLDGSTFTTNTNSGVMYLTLKPFAERIAGARSAETILGEVEETAKSVREATVLALMPPPVRGLGTSGGFKMQAQLEEGDDQAELFEATKALIAGASSLNKVTRVFTPFSNDTPQLSLNIDRTKAQMLNVPLANVFDALQINIGGTYVNDFNIFGRVYQVRAQAASLARLEANDIEQLKVRSAVGAVVPLGSLATFAESTGPQIVQRHNLLYSIPVQGEAAAGTSTTEAIAAMESLAKERLPAGTAFEWTELAYQERAAGGSAVYALGIGLLLVFLVLAAQYESWSLPLSIILVVPTGVLTALLGVRWMGLDNNILTQIGMIVLVGLATKNAVLIVEFAHQIETEKGVGPVAAAVEAARLRLRPIAMTAGAFILGVLPLVTAEGAGAEMRRALGTSVFFGMLGATAFGLILTPAFYVMIRSIVLKYRHGKAFALA